MKVLIGTNNNGKVKGADAADEAIKIEHLEM